MQTLRGNHLDGVALTGPAMVWPLPAWIADHNTEAPHSGLGMLSPVT